MKINRRSFFGLLFAPYIERFRKVFRKKEELVSYRFTYKVVVLDRPLITYYKYSNYNSNYNRFEAAGRLGKKAAQRMDELTRKVFDER